MRGLTAAATLAALAALVIWGVSRLEAQVHGHPRFAHPPEIKLVNVPEGLEERVGACLAPWTRVPWILPRLCRRIAERLGEVAWIKRVDSVRRFPDGNIEVACTYRQPVALVQVGGDFYLLSEELIRLPGRYAYTPQLPVVQGVGAAPSPVGDRWAGGDLRAAVAIMQRLGREPFARQIVGVDVTNYGGRRDAHAAHLELLTDRPGGRIVWGSAPGEEVEENDTEQKASILRSNHERFGRADAGYALIDVSTHPDRFIIRG